VEAFVSIMMIFGVALIVINSDKYTSEDDVTAKVYQTETAILREIQMNESLREYILGTSGAVEFENFPDDLKNLIEKRIPEYLDCTSKICGIQGICDADDIPEEKNVYVQSVMIAANSETYSPHILKLFCWI